MTPFTLTTLYWTDPLRSAVGGIDTFVQGLIRFAPPDVRVDVVGVTSDPLARPPGRWLSLQLDGKPFRLFPLLTVRDPWARAACPWALRYTAALRAKRARFSSDVFLTHAIEPVLALRSGSTIAAVMHLDPEEVFAGSSSSRWRRFPRAYRAVEKAALANVSRLYVVRESARERYDSLGLDAPVIFVPTGIDSATFTLPTQDEPPRSPAPIAPGIRPHRRGADRRGRRQARAAKGFRPAHRSAAARATRAAAPGVDRRRSRTREPRAVDCRARSCETRIPLGPSHRRGHRRRAPRRGFLWVAFFVRGHVDCLARSASLRLAGDRGRRRRSAPDDRRRQDGIVVHPRTSPRFARAMIEVAQRRREFTPEACAGAVAGFGQRTVAAALHADLRAAVQRAR